MEPNNTKNMADISLSEAVNAYLKKLHNDPSIPESNNEPRDATTLPETSNKAEYETTASLTDIQIERIRAPLLKELEKLCNAVPDPEAYDDSGFDSPINKDRFENHLDHKQNLIYKRTDTWDRQPVEVGLLIPKGIDWSKNVGILVKWHGGALVSISYLLTICHDTYIHLSINISQLRFCFLKKKGKTERKHLV